MACSVRRYGDCQTPLRSPSASRQMLRQTRPCYGGQCRVVWLDIGSAELLTPQRFSKPKHWRWLCSRCVWVSSDGGDEVVFWSDVNAWFFQHQPPAEKFGRYFVAMPLKRATAWTCRTFSCTGSPWLAMINSHSIASLAAKAIGTGRRPCTTERLSARAPASKPR
jgi:hypothetical protein